MLSPLHVIQDRISIWFPDREGRRAVPVPTQPGGPGATCSGPGKGDCLLFQGAGKLDQKGLGLVSMDAASEPGPLWRTFFQ